MNLSMNNTESTISYEDFLNDMVSRGLQTPLTITTDGAPGLTKAVDIVWPKSYRIRCWFHKMQNLRSKVSALAWPEFKSLVCDARDAPTYEDGEARMNKIIDKYQWEFPEACRSLKEDMGASLNHLRVISRHRPFVRTSNLVERSFGEERRRTKVIPHIWTERTAEKLIFATLTGLSDRWSRKQFSDVEQRILRDMMKTVLKEENKFNKNNDKQSIKNKRTNA